MEIFVFFESFDESEFLSTSLLASQCYRTNYVILAREYLKVIESTQHQLVELEDSSNFQVEKLLD